MAARVLVAQIGAGHGLRGEVRLWSFMQDPMAVKDYSLQSEDGTRTFTIESLRPGKDFLVARFAGVTDRNAAEALRNLKLYVPRDQLPDPEAEEFYHTDLIGLAVVDTSGRALGTVAAIHNFGAGDIIEVKPETGTGIMLPFSDAVVPVIDIAAGRLVVDPPDGTFDRADAQPPSAASVDGEPAQTSRNKDRMPAR
jgi:16S rRNA processing protein RimM